MPEHAEILRAVHEMSMSDHAPSPGVMPRHAAPRPSSGRLKLIGLIALIAAAALVVLGIMSRMHSTHTLKTWTQQQTIPTVNVIGVGGAGAGRDLVLPATVQAFNSAQINSRVSGYIHRWYADIGQHVSAGQLLADIDTPEVDQQIGQARADVKVAQANQQLAATTARRWTGMLAQDAVSRQETDEKTGDLAAKTSLVASAQANLNRLMAMKGFARITAPFAGVVTTRSADIGQLVAAGVPGAQPLFTIADSRRLRIYVRVPQAYSAAVHNGMAASLTAPEFPGRVFHAVLVSSAPAVSDQTGAMLVELQIDNPDGALKPGEYAQATFAMPSGAGAVTVPASALMTRHSGMAVAVIGADSRVHIHPVGIARDLGSSVELSGGVRPGDRIVDSPADTLADGDLVRISGASAEAAARADRSGAAAHG